MVNINLLPKEIIEQQRFQNIVKIIIFFFLCIIGIFSLIYLSKISYLAQLNFQSSKLDYELSKLEPVIKEVKQLETIRTTLQARKKLVEGLLFNGLCYPKLMVSLLRSLPDGVWLVELKTETLFDNERKIKEIKTSLVCNSYDKFSIANFLANLEQSKCFRNVTLGKIEIAQQDKYELHNFVVDFVYIPE